MWCGDSTKGENVYSLAKLPVHAVQAMVTQTVAKATRRLFLIDVMSLLPPV